MTDNKIEKLGNGSMEYNKHTKDLVVEVLKISSKLDEVISKVNKEE